MKGLPKILHRIYRSWVKGFLSIGYDFRTWSDGPLPEGPKIYCSNHFSSSDAHYGTTLMKEDIHMIIGPGFNVPFIKHFLTYTQQIPANTKEVRANAVSKAVEYLKKGESVYIFPEGMLNTGKELLEFKKGIARVYLECPVPVIPIGVIAPRRSIKKKNNQFVGHEMTIVSKNYYANIGEPMMFKKEEEISLTDRPLAEEIITQKIKDKIEYLIDDIKNEKFWS